MPPATATSVTTETATLENLPALEVALAEECENHLRIFTRQAWKHLEPGPFIDGRHIDLMDE